MDPATITDIVAIDGPAGAGKSTAARMAADRLGFAFLDSGAMYRAATWWALHQNVDLTDAGALVAATAAMPLKLERRDGRTIVHIDGTDVSGEIRTSRVTNAIRHLDAIPGVRAHLVERQRRIGAERPTVAEGRDMGTVVFPNAKCKIFLDASLPVRAARRARELRAGGTNVDDQTIEEEIRRRDESDSARAVSPLRPAPDAVRIDTSELTLDDMVDRVVEEARRAL